MLNPEQLELYKKIHKILEDDIRFVEQKIKMLEDLNTQMESDAQAMEDMLREGRKLGIYKEDERY